MSAPAAADRVAPDDLDRALRLLRARETWLSVGFLLLSFPIGLFWFVALVTLIAVGASLSLVWIGLPILAATMLLWVGGARAERARLRLFFGEAIPSPYRPRLPGPWTARSALRSARRRAGDPAVWRDLAYLLLLFPLGVAELVVAVVAVSVPLSLVALPAYYWMGTGPQLGPGVTVDTLSEALLGALLGVAIAVPAALAVIGLARGHLLLGRWLLGPSRNAALTERVDVLTRSRSGAVEAQLLERQRIERDLHDGAQQRLVALAMDLGMAKEKLLSDPEGARTLVASSHEEAKRVLAELRDLVRGIHPAVLTDRGLDAAISAIAGRSPVPVRVSVRLEGRLPEAVEAAAYFVVVEALTNVAKHANATEARVLGRCVDGWLIVEVVDDGDGGAIAGGGTGLAGLRDRVAALDGRLTVESPAGGPTTVRAEIPVA